MASTTPFQTRRWWLLAPLIALVLFGAAAGYQAGRWVAAPPTSADTPTPPPYPVVIHEPQSPPGVDTGLRDIAGQPILANCTTCHATRPPNRQTRDGRQLQDFHTGLHTDHGGLSCLSCHNAQDYGTLSKADGTPITFQKQRQLCAQCHGPQHRDYVNGTHGGMTGYWDLTRGGRTRNTCTDCHDPHAPQYPTVSPVFKPKDRFLPPAVDHASGSSHQTDPTSTSKAHHE